MTTSSEQRDREHAGDLLRIDLEPEQDEEQGGEQVAERVHQARGASADRPRDRDADEERADRGRHVELLRDARDEQGDADHTEEQRLVGGRVDAAG